MRRGIMRWGAGLLLGLLLALGEGVRPAGAQTRADSAAVWLDAARQLRAAGHTGAAQALLELLQQRFSGTAAAAEAATLLSTARSEPEPERPGRVELLVWGTTYGLWLGVAVPVMTGSDSPEVYGLGLLAGGPAGFFATRAYLQSHPVTEGQARAITFGGTWGSYQGFGWTEVLDLGVDKCEYRDEFGTCYGDGSPSGKALVAGSVIGGLTGIATGAMLARRPISSGVATTVSFGGLWGTWYGLAAGILADMEDDDLLAATLAGGDAGLLAMALLAPKWNPSRNRARLVSLGGLVGLLGGAGLDLIIQPEDEKLGVAIPAATSALGLILAANSMKDRGRKTDSPERGEPGGALLDYRAGRWGMDVPAVGLRRDRERGQAPRTSLYVPVFRAAF